jgi:hypothetical protein
LALFSSTFVSFLRAVMFSRYNNNSSNTLPYAVGYETEHLGVKIHKNFFYTKDTVHEKQTNRRVCSWVQHGDEVSKTLSELTIEERASLL